MGSIKNVVQKWGKTGLIGVFLILAFLAGNTTGYAPTVQVLSAHTHTTPTPAPTIIPLPTSVPVTVINNIILPTSASITVVPTAVPTIIPTPTGSGPPTPTQSPVSPTPTLSVQPTDTPTPTSTIVPTATPTPPAVQTATVLVEYAGEHAESTYTVSLTSGETAWQVVQDSVGLSNLHYIDYGGSLGIFITGFNGIDANASQYYDFQVNGTSASVGVSSYVVANGDTLKFVLTGF